jgi:FHS family L-fucose permease-like MFS transporter
MIAPPASHEVSRPAEPLLPSGVLRPFVLVTGLFFLWGLPNNLNDVLIRQFMKSFAINRFQAGLVQSAFYLGYFLLALPAGLLIRQRGYKAGFLTGLVCFALGCFLFWPAAITGSYAFFLTSLFIVASGLAFLETSANPFIAQLGPPTTAERRLNLSQAFNPFGAIGGVLIGTRFIFSGVELTPLQIRSMQHAGTYAAYLHRETLRVVTPYLALAAIATIWTVLIATTRFPDVVHMNQQTDRTVQNGTASWRSLLRNRSLLYAVLAQFLYVGAQVGTWSYFIPYAQEYTHVTERVAGLLLTATLVAFGVGRFSSAYVMRWLSPSRLMGIYALANIVLLSIGIFAPGWTGLFAILTTSFFMSIMYPTIFAVGLRGLGEHANLAASFLVMAILGGAVLTPLMGLIAEHSHGTAMAYLLPAVGYLVIAAFARQAEERLEIAQ